MRGEHYASITTSSAVPGIIPACAGSTKGVNRSAITPGDHPRMRGEHGLIVATEYKDMGSSPHARGAQTRLSDGLLLLGIIPACAGSTPRGNRTKPGRRDHPRMRGEHTTGR